MEYRPDNYDSRVALAELLAERLTSWGFARISIDGTREHVYARECGADLECRVYTTIDGAQCRAKAKDAIRVCMVYTGGEKPRGCGKDRRVYRVGVVGEIADRVKGRIDRITDGVDTCKRCGTPTFKSKKGNQVCAALCWTKEEPQAKPASKRLSDDARTLLAALVYRRPDGWWRVVPGKERRRPALKELRDIGLIEVNLETRECYVTDRGRKSYSKAVEAGLFAA